MTMERIVESRPLVQTRLSLAARFGAFVAERFPFALAPAFGAFRSVSPSDPGRDEAAIEALRRPVSEALLRAIGHPPAESFGDTVPGVTVETRMQQAKAELLEACDGFLRREALEASLTREERIEILRGMILTRATDNRLKAFFSGAEVRYGDAAFQGKGFRSLGQEAIYASAIRLRRGEQYRTPDGSWKGDVVAPLIRDLGAALAMRPHPETVRLTLSAQMGKAGPPMEGKDLHVGDFGWGNLPPTAPLSISTLTIAGMAMAFARDGSGRARLHAHLWPRAPRRHALPRQGAADLLGVSPARALRLRGPAALRVLVEARSHPDVRRAAGVRKDPGRGRSRSLQGGGGGP